MAMELSIVTPTFNEAQNLPLLYAALSKVLQQIDWELIVVDDNSQDKTWQIARAMATDYDNIRVIRRTRSRGLSSACIEGMQLAAGEFTLIMDADLQHDESIIPQMIESLRRGTDLVIGSRFVENASATGLASDKRRCYTRIGNFLGNLFLDHRLSDPLTGFFALRTERCMQLSPKLSDTGFKILLDLLIVGHFERVEEIGYQFQKREAGESKLDHVIVWQFIVFLLEKMTRGLIPARFISFLAVGASGLVVHFVTLFALMKLSPLFWLAQLGATLVALSSNFLINNWLTFYDMRLTGLEAIRGLLLYAVFASVGIIANVGVATYLVEQYRGEFEYSNWVIVVAATAGILIDTLWKFVMSERFVWNRNKGQESNLL